MGRPDGETARREESPAVAATGANSTNGVMQSWVLAAPATVSPKASSCESGF